MYKYLLGFLFLMLLFGCNDDTNITNINGFDRHLVIIADDEPTSDMIIKIKGLVNKEHPDVNIHYFPAKPFDVSEASYLLELAAESYPEDTYFAVIVDPGLNDDKLIIKSGERTVLAPDNGVSTRFNKLFPPEEIIKVNNLSIYDNEYDKIVSIPADIFYSKSINYMLGDSPASDFGESTNEIKELDITEPAYNNGVAEGEVLFVYNFGNCDTNIPKDIMNNFEQGDLLEISTESKTFFAVYGSNYSAVEMNENVAVISGEDDLRLAVNYGNISERYDLHSGTKITIKKAKIKAGILQYNNSGLVQDIVAGTIASLTEKGFIEGDNIEYIIKNAEGDIPSLKNLTDELLSEGIDIIIPVSTPAAQAAIDFVPENIPVIYTYVTSPEFAGILNKRTNVAGLSDATNVNDYLTFVKELLPDISKAGRLYNPDEANSQFFQENFVKNAPYFELDYVTREVTNAAILSGAFDNLLSSEPDAILIGADNTMNLNMQTLSDLCKENNIPLIGDSGPNTYDGALASISVDYDALAKSTGDYTSKVILGYPADELEIKRFGNSVISLNQLTANAIGFEFPQAIIDRAAEILE